MYTVGWKEYVDFPDWGIFRVKAKMDTGARTSALDVQSYDLQESKNGGLIAELRLALEHRRPERVRVVRLPAVGMAIVSNSSGVRERRPIIEAKIRLGPVVKCVRFTITNRSAMLFRMILGRKALEGDFAVDVSKKYLLRLPRSGR